jgi:amino acid transporter
MTFNLCDAGCQNKVQQQQHNSSESLGGDDHQHVVKISSLNSKLQHSQGDSIAVVGEATPKNMSSSQYKVINTVNTFAEDENDDVEDPSNTCSSSASPSSNCPSNHVSSSGTKPALGKAALAVLIFYSVSGGPFGVESAVRSGGYLYTLIGFCIGPIIWSVQEASMTAELACAFPEASGGMAWVEEAFGPLAGWLAGYLGWLAGATDNAIYPVLFLDYAVTAIGGSSTTASMHPLLRFIGLGITSVILSYINWLGLDIVGNMAIVICCIAMSPFVIVSCVGLFHMNWSRLLETPPIDEYDMLINVTDVSGGLFPNAGYVSTGILWRPFLNNLFWNLNSFDSAASFSADVGTRPEQIIPSAMKWSVAMVMISYLIPLGVAFGATHAQPYEWVDGYWATVAGQIAGPYIEGWTVFAAGISNIAMFQAELSADAFQLMGMADRGHVPSIFSTRSRYGTPTYGIILGTVVIVALGCSGLDTLIELLNFSYSIALLMEYAAFIKLRISRPDLPRPYKIPLGTVGCIIFFLPTLLFTLVVLLLSKYESFIFASCTMLLGIVIYACKNGLHKYNNLSSSSSPQNHCFNRKSTRCNSDDTQLNNEVESNSNNTEDSISNFDDDDNFFNEQQGDSVMRRKPSPASFTFT